MRIPSAIIIPCFLFFFWKPSFLDLVLMEMLVCGVAKVPL